MTHDLSNYWMAWHSYQPWIIKILTAMGIFLLFYMVGSLIKALVNRLAQTALMEQHVIIGLLANTSRIAIIVIGAITALGTIGINVSALVASLGLTGFGLSFAFQDVLSSALSGVMLLLYRPFQLGDHLTVSKFTGKVTKIDLRYITLQNQDQGERILVPNTLAFKESIVIRKASKGHHDTTKATS